MLESYKHINSKGEELDFISLGIYGNYEDLRTYEWSYNSTNNKITEFYKGIAKKTISFVFAVDEEKATEIKNAFYEHFEIDILTQKAGYFVINGYKYYCYANKSVKADYLVAKRLLKLTLDIVSDNSFWYKETLRTIDFTGGSVDTINDTELLIYPFSFPFTYGDTNTSRVTNNDFVESDGVIRVYGAATNPVVLIGDNVYAVNCSVKSSEYLEINTAERTINIVDNVGNKTNMFNYRNKVYDTFAKIPTGTVTVSTSDAFKIDIIIVEKRGEPRWN